MASGPKWRTRAQWALRAKVFTRDRFRCVSCGWGPSNVPEDYDGRYAPMEGLRSLDVDHIRPRARGGKTELANLQTLCAPCNRRKWLFRDSPEAP